MQLEIEIKSQIREFFDLINRLQIQNYYTKDKTNWDALCASLHLINDLQIPKEEYQSLNSINYLEAIGIMQTIYIEQDSVQTLKFAISEKTNINRFTLSKYNVIRNLRNQIFGHPSDKSVGKLTTRHFFYIEDDKKQIFKHVYWGTEKEIDSDHYILSKLIEENSKLTIEYLREIKQDFKTYFEKIMSDYTIDFNTLFNGANYTFEKLITKENDEIAIACYKSISQDLIKVRLGLKERNALYEFEKDLQVIEFLNNRFEAIINEQTCADTEFYAYSTILRDKIRELQKELKNFDNLFN